MMRANDGSRRCLAAAALAVAATAFAQRASAQAAARETTPEPGPRWLGARGAVTAPTLRRFLQFGVGFVAEAMADPGALCARTDVPCVLGSGAGIVARGGWARGPFYFGGAYELAKLDSNNIYRLATLQQLRAEVRRHVETGANARPYATMALGAAAYGNEWGVATWGGLAAVGLGVETELSRTTVFGAAVGYRALLLGGYTDSGLSPRETGVAHFVTLDVMLEAREPL